MSRYGLLYPEYFDGPTGREIQRLGGNNALVLGAFLVSNRLSNMIGLYRLPLGTITLSVTHLKGPAIQRALAALVAANFISYDFGTEFVWVHEMARIRVGLMSKDGRLKADDNRVRFINSLYRDLEDNPFLPQFFHRYAKTLHLKGERTSARHHYMSPLPSPLEGPPKPVNRSYVLGTSQSTTDVGDQDQTYGSGRSTGASRRRFENNGKTKTPPHKVLCAMAREELEQDPTLAGGGWAEAVKQRLAAQGFAYPTPRALTAAIDAVAHVLERRAGGSRR